jgi:hypothetical protein
MYFLRRRRPVEIVAERVRSVRVSLNAPVLTANELPQGPARAAILIQRDAKDGWLVSVGVRSNRTGEVAYWSYDGALTTDTDVSVASDGAVTFSEALGFLFDDEELPHGAAAAKRWSEWLAGDRGSLAFAGDDAADGAQELVLEDLVDEDTQLALPLPSSTGDDWASEESPPPLRPRPASPRPAVAPAEAPTPGLSKFRVRPSAGGGEEGTGPARRARQPLARVQLVKRRSLEEERRLLLRKLLTVF